MGSSSVWVVGFIVATLAAEVVLGRHRWVGDRREWLINGICILGAVVRPLFALPGAMLIAWLFPAGRGILSHVPFVPALVAILVLAEFANYWVHRAAHELKGSRWFDWLWRMHRTHHTAKYVNVLLNYRLSLFWGLVAGVGWVMSLAIYLGQLRAAGVSITIFALWGIVTHSDFRWDDVVRSNRILGPAFRGLEHIFVSPGIHHSHHGYGPDGGSYRNFGIFLSIFDWMFGTLHIPNGRPARYGIPGASPHWADDAFSPLNVGTLLLRNRATESQEDMR